MRRFLLTLALGLLFNAALLAQSALPRILPLQERAQVQEELLQDRVRTLLPELMERSGIDLWLVIAREYNEDPVLRTLLPPTWLSARRTTMLLMHHPAGSRYHRVPGRGPLRRGRNV